jgi:hypothetical protein
MKRQCSSVKLDPLDEIILLVIMSHQSYRSFQVEPPQFEPDRTFPKALNFSQAEPRVQYNSGQQTAVVDHQRLPSKRGF